MSLDQGFVDRREDLAFLEKRWRGDSPELVVVTGRRRVGKTTLLQAFADGKPHVYHLVNQEEGALQLRRFRDAFIEEFGGVTPEVEDWHDLFSYLQGELDERGRFLIVLDEFPYLVEEDESIPSYFQALMDEYLDETEAFLCLAGSSIGMMEDEVLARESPLYGRRTGKIDLSPFRIEQTREMFPSIPMEKLVQVYAVFGGTPHYLSFVDPDGALAREIERLICDPRGPLHDEPELLIRQEFRRPNRYVSILQAVAAGRTSPKAIADHTSIEPQSVPKYLAELQRVRLLDHRVPVTEEGKRTRRGIYVLGDPMFRFWYRFVAPRLSQAEAAPEALTDRHILPQLPAHVGTVFEDVCRQLTPALFDGYGRVGGWWYQDAEVDVVGLDEADDRLLVGECKWQDGVDAGRITSALEATARQIRWREDNRTERFVLFAKSFERRTQDALCLDLEDIEERIEESQGSSPR